MFNPFKKNNNSYKLDEMKLPSLSDKNKSDNKDIGKDLPSLPDLNNNKTDNNLNTPNFNNSLDMSNNNSNSNNNLSNNNSSFDSFSNNTNNSFDSSSSLSSSNPIHSMNNSQEKTNMDSQNNNSDYDVLKAKFESFESKLTLLEARQQNMNNRIEIIYKILLNEISDETKQKLHLESMVDSIKNQNN